MGAVGGEIANQWLFALHMKRMRIVAEQQAAWTIANTINVVGVGIAFVAVIMALLKDVLIDLLVHPELSVTIRDRAPDCHKTKFGRQVIEALKRSNSGNER